MLREKDKKIIKNCFFCFFSWVWPSYQVVYTGEQNKKPGLQVPQRRVWGSLPGRRTTRHPSLGAPLPGGPVMLASKDRAEATSRPVQKFVAFFSNKGVSLSPISLPFFS